MNRGDARRLGSFAALAAGTIAAGLATAPGTIAGTPGLEGSFNPSVSADGRYVAFSSFRDELGGPINTDVLNVYVYDRKRKKVQLISRRSGPGGAGGDDDSGNPSISDDGRYVAFHTQADNLGGPAADVNNVYVYDRERKKVSLVSRRGGAGGVGGDATSVFPDISGNGRFVAFATFADNLGGPAADAENVYVYDRKRKRLQLVSRRSGRGGGGGDDDSYEASISTSGRYVGFTTEADNLGGPVTDTGNVYVYDRKRKKVRLISRQSGAGGAGGDGFSEDPSLSASGRFVAFETQADNLGGPAADVDDNIYVYDRKRKRVRLISRQSGANGAGGDDESTTPKISAGGRFVAFDTEADNLGGSAADVDNVYVYDRKRKRVRLVSRESGAGGEGGNATSASASISADGRFIAFFTNADNFGGAAAAVGSSNIYMFDRIRNRVLLVSQPSS